MSPTRLCCALFAVALYLILSVSPLQAQSSNIQLWIISFHDDADLASLASELDVWEVDHVAKTLLAPLTHEEATIVSQTHTMTLAPDQSPLTPPEISAAQVNGIPGFPCYRTVDESFATLDQLAATYPTLVKAIDIGDTWDKITSGGPAGYDLRLLVITNQAKTTPKFRFMLMGAIHAREYVTAELALRFAESLLQGYGRDATATWLLDRGELHLLTYGNPDGRRIAETGQLWRKNTHREENDSCIISLPSRSYGVDLNRNSSFHWNECDGFNCSSANSCSETYRGISPASEPEVAGIQAYLRKVFPDQRGELLTDAALESTPGLFLSLHSYGQLALFPWGFTTTHAPNAHGLSTIARHLGYPLGYTVCQAGGAGCLYQTDGTTDDFTYGDLGIPSFTIELGTNFFQSCSYFETEILQQGLDALRYAFNAAPHAYALSQGPDVVNVSTSITTVAGAENVVINAMVDASRMAPLSGSGNDEIIEPVESILGASLTVDELPWEPAPVIYAMTAIDGSFDSNQEATSTSLALGCFPSGSHTLFVQGEDLAGDRGTLGSAFVTVTNSSPFTATISSEQSSVRDGETIRYTVALTNTGSMTSTYTIEPVMAVQFTISHTLPISLVAGASLQLTVLVTPQQNTADNRVSAVLIIRSLDEPAQCRQIQMATPVEAWDYRYRLLQIRKP